MEAQQKLSELAKREIKRAQSLPRPLARISGPLTTGQLGYEKNAKRFTVAEQILTENGISIFSLAESEAEIFGRGYLHSDIMQYFHQPLLDAGVFDYCYFLPNWQDSKGASWERAYITQHTTIEVREFPESWFSDRI